MHVKTSKIAVVSETKEHTNKYGTTIYHNLIMENGDKINIGKKKLQQVGWELNYIITEQGQQEYNKARTPKREEMPQQNGSTQPPKSSKGYGPDQDAILYQVCLKETSLFYSNFGFSHLKEDMRDSEKMEHIADAALVMAQKAKKNIQTLKNS